MNLEADRNFQPGRAMVRISRQLHGLVARGYPGIKFVDIDVAPSRVRGQGSLQNLAEGEQRVLRIAGSLDTSQDDGRYLYEKPLSWHAFLVDLEQYAQACDKSKETGSNLNDALEASLESRLPWKDYCRETGGFTPSAIPMYAVAEQYSRTVDAFKELGFNFNREEWQRFIKDAILTPEEFEGDFKETEARLEPVFKGMIEYPERIKYRTEIQSEDKSWVNWISGDRHGLVLKINAHPRNSSRLFRGNGGVFVPHEKLTHITQARILRREIDRGEINPGYGIMTVPGPEQFASEGVAMNLPFLLPPLLEALLPHERFALEYSHLRNMVQANILYDLHKDNPLTRVELVQRALHYLPPETEERINNFLNAGRYDPVNRSYYRAYHDGGYYFWVAARELPENARLELVKEFFAHPMIPDQIKGIVCQKKKKTHIP